MDSKLPRVGTTIFTVMSRLAVEHSAVNLGQGFPDFEPPDLLCQRLSEAIREGRNQYAPMHGVAALREAIAEKTRDDYGRVVDAEREVTVVSGASEAIFDAVQAVVRPGDEVIVLDPCYDCYEPAIDLAGGRAIHVPLDPVDFSVDWDRVEAAFTEHTRLLMLNSPHNPSGAVFDADDIAALGHLVERFQPWLISDEVYEHIVFDGRRHESLSRYPNLAERTFVVSSFGKTFHCTGWKVGYCLAPPALTEEFRKVHQYNTFCTFGPAQWALAAMLREQPAHHRELAGFYQDRRDHFRALLADTPLRLLPVPGGYFQLVDYSEVSDLDDAAFVRWLTIEHGVAAIPLSPFYQQPPVDQRLARLCFAKNPETLATAAERLARLPRRGESVTA